MRLYARKKRNGERVWWASWTEGSITKRRSTRCPTRAAAEIVIARWDRERADPVYAAAQSATFGIEASRFLTACEEAVARKRMSKETLSMYRQKAGTLVRVLEREGTEPLRLANINATTFPAYLAQRRAEFRDDRERDITESTLYKEWVAFRQILKQAWREQRFGRDPASLKPQHFGPEYKPRETALSWAQVDVLLGALPPLRMSTVAFAIAFGARRKEVFAARAGDVDLERNRVRLRGTKTALADQTLPIVSLMKRYALLANPPFQPWGNSRRDLSKVCKALAIPIVTWNDLRRTFASLLVQAGVPPHIVAKLLRHSTTAMVDRVYGRQTDDSLEQLIEANIREPRVNQAAAGTAPNQKVRR